ncbi:MAG: AraC family transcriptional regulator [Cyclobacteriaceae bacterium]
MKPIYLKVTNSPENSFDIRHEIDTYFKNPLHFHPELELTLILESTGTQFMGSSIGRFEKNDLTLAGPNLPHFWRNDPIYYKNHNGLKAEAIIIRFKENFLTKPFFQLPELNHINMIFQKSKRGLKIYGDTKKRIAYKMCQMLHLNGAERIISLLDILNSISLSNELRFLCDKGMDNTYDITDSTRINKVYNFVMDNFMHEIHLDEISEIANMNRTAFCRYFKAKTGKTLFGFVQEIRIGYACKLLIDNKFTVSQVCYECGFNNESHFIKQFKLFKKLTPLKYQKQFLIKSM